jgi:hypothetical protein
MYGVTDNSVHNVKSCANRVPLNMITLRSQTVKMTQKDNVDLNL